MIGHNYGNSETKVDKGPTDIQRIFHQISDQNSRLGEVTGKLEDMGHRLKNTNFPTASNNDKVEQVKPDGIIQEIGMQLDRYNSIIFRLQELESKLSMLL